MNKKFYDVAMNDNSKWKEAICREGELYSRETFTTNIRNSAIIVMKNINSPSGKPVGYTINNNGKSFILVLGKLYFYKVDININAIGLIPSSEKVLNFINEFLTN